MSDPSHELYEPRLVAALVPNAQNEPEPQTKKRRCDSGPPKAARASDPIQDEKMEVNTDDAMSGDDE